jgi:NitT/TauT family transport system substrate-binding protein
MTSIRILLNSGFAGPHAGFFLGDAMGCFRDEGLEIAWHGGDGAAGVLPALFDGSCDAAYGDLACLPPLLAGREPHTGPCAAFVAFRKTPLTIAVRRGGPVRQPVDLAGRRVSGHGQDAALILFPAYAAAAGFDAATVRILADGASLGEQVRRMVEDDAADGVFGFVNTIIASLGEAGLSRLEDEITFLEYASLLPDYCGNALIISRAFQGQYPDIGARLFRACHRGFAAAIADPEAGVAAVAKVNASLDVPVQLRRWRSTILMEMDHAMSGSAELGRMDSGRLQRSSAATAKALRLQRTPAADEMALPHVLLGQMMK